MSKMNIFFGNEKYIQSSTDGQLMGKQIIPKYTLVLVDHNGNIYLKHNDVYYIITIDPSYPSGIELIKIKDPSIFKKNRDAYGDISSDIKSGIIRAGSITLRGKIHDSITDMTDEEQIELSDKNEFSISQLYCEEKKYYWVKYADHDSIDEPCDSEFYINGAIKFNELSNDNENLGMVHSDILISTFGSFETMLINGDLGSTHIISSTERIDGYSSAYLTIYTSGKFKANFIDNIKLSYLCFDTISGNIIPVPITDNKNGIAV